MTFTDDDNERGRAIANSYTANEARRKHIPPDINWDAVIGRLRDHLDDDEQES